MREEEVPVTTKRQYAPYTPAELAKLIQKDMEEKGYQVEEVTFTVSEVIQDPNSITIAMTEARAYVSGKKEKRYKR